MSRSRSPNLDVGRFQGMGVSNPTAHSWTAPLSFNSPAVRILHTFPLLTPCASTLLSAATTTNCGVTISAIAVACMSAQRAEVIANGRGILPQYGITLHRI